MSCARELVRPLPELPFLLRVPGVEADLPFPFLAFEPFAPFLLFVSPMRRRRFEYSTSRAMVDLPEAIAPVL